jgi:putative membrane-bound dehydrogenase-like protein
MKVHPLIGAALCFFLLAPHAFSAGKQLTGQHAPATTPALTPEEAQKKFTLPPGFEIRPFASEPDVVNPVAMTWDERGRLWVAELYEYPLGAPQGAKPRDRVKILEDVDGDGHADKVTIFADGLNLATGILLGNGGVYVGQAPDFLFLQDTDGDDVADRRIVLKTGFGLHDRHELLNGFTWGPDGWLYMTHGVFTHSEVKDPNDANAPSVTVDAAIARFHPKTRKIEVYADGTSNPWGVDFDRAGNAFLSACVIEHLFHMTPGGLYVRQGGSPQYPYSYGLLPSINDHKHKMAAYAGIQIYQGDQFPAEYRGKILMGNIHDNSVHMDNLTPKGSSFVGSQYIDFVRANDGWFMPVSTQVGPDGAVWIMDWYDKYPCYQNANADPEGVDREYGRIWRVVYTGDQKGKPVASHAAGMDLKKLSGPELVSLLGHSNVWQRRMAQRLLTERQDPSSKEPLLKMLASGKSSEARLHALWTLHAAEFLEEKTLDRFTKDDDALVRLWVARLTGERRDPGADALARLKRLASDKDAAVRLAVAVAARQYASGSLTVNTPVSAELAREDTLPVLTTLMEQPGTGEDPVLPFLIWTATEPKLSKNLEGILSWMEKTGPRAMPVSGQILAKTMRRVCDNKSSEQLDLVVRFLGHLPASHESLVATALDGLIEAQKGKAFPPTIATDEIFARWLGSKNSTLADRAQRLGALWGNRAAAEGMLRHLADASQPVPKRIDAIKAARQIKSDGARSAVLALISPTENEALALEAIRALGEIGGDAKVGTLLVERWPTMTPAQRRATAEVLASRPQWVPALFSGLENKVFGRGDLPVTVIRNLASSKDTTVQERVKTLIGRIRESDSDKIKLIAEKRKMVMTGTPDIEAGREVARKTCFVCHKLYGEGAEIGPDLTGVGRSSLDALLSNVIDPNAIIGKGYENVEIETKDGRAISGRVTEDTANRVKILSAGPKEDVIARSEIASMRTTEMSVMPEGLEQIPEADFRNLIWFILNPPQENRPLTPALRRQLAGEEPRVETAQPAPVDRESVALWNPAWKVICPEFEGAPRRLTDYAGRKSVLMTHPFDQQSAAALERKIALPTGSKSKLIFFAASHEQGDWELHAKVDDKLVLTEKIDGKGASWKRVELDLAPYAGRTVTVRLENAANNWFNEFGYWSDIQLAP